MLRLVVQGAEERLVSQLHPVFLLHDKWSNSGHVPQDKISYAFARTYFEIINKTCGKMLENFCESFMVV